MEKSKAAVFVGMEKPLEVREFEVAPVTADTALVRMQMAAVCGSDVHYWHLPTTPAPAIMGHENVGVLAALGKNVTKDVLGQPLKEGDRVLFKRSNCGRCPGCVLGENCKVNPPYGLRPKFEPPYLKGGFSQYVYLDPNPWLLKVPEDLSTERALISNIGNHTLLRGIEKIGAAAASGAGIDTVVVQGSGPIGMGAIIQQQHRGGRTHHPGGRARQPAGAGSGDGGRADHRPGGLSHARGARGAGAGADRGPRRRHGHRVLRRPHRGAGRAGHGAQRRQILGHRADRPPCCWHGLQNSHNYAAIAAGPSNQDIIVGDHHCRRRTWTRLRSFLLEGPSNDGPASAAGGGGGRRRSQSHPAATGQSEAPRPVDVRSPPGQRVLKEGLGMHREVVRKRH